MFILFFYCLRLEFFSPGVLSLNPWVIFTTTLPGFSKEIKGYTHTHSHTHTHTHLWYCFYLVPKEIQPVHPKGNQSWIFIGRTDAEANTLATWCKELTHLRTPWCWETEGDDRGWDGWMASPTECRWVWVNSGSWWRTGRPGVLQSMGSQRVRHNRVTELNWLSYTYTVRHRHGQGRRQWRKVHQR